VTDISDGGRSASPAQPALASICFGALALLAIALFAVEAFPAVVNALARMSFAFADSQWSEPPLILQLHRMAIGQPAYLPTPLANSYDYGPLYLIVLGALRRLLGQPDATVPYRALSMALGALTIVPLACAALAIAVRAGIARGDPAKTAIALGTALLGIAVLARSITFDTLHPDDFAFLLLATSLALHFALAARILRAPFVWALVAVGIASAFGKQNAAVVVPLLLAGLGGARVISLRLALAACGAVVVAIVVVVLALPNDVRAWILFVPLNQPYEFWPARIAQCWQYVTFWQPYLAVSFVPAAAALGLLGRRCGLRALSVDAAAIVALAIVAFTGFFKTLGIWNNLTFLAIATIPYAGALLGSGFLASYRGARVAASVAVAFVTLFALGVALRGGEKQVPDAQIYSELSAVDALATQLCATKQPIVVTVFPQAFFGCPTAIYALVPSFQELTVAFPRYYAGPTAFDQPIAARYAVVAAGTNGAAAHLGLPGAWKAEFPHLIKRVVAVQGWGANYFPVEVRVFEHR